jgi:hypothetical protein
MPKAIDELKNRTMETWDRCWALWSTRGLSPSYFIGDILQRTAAFKNKKQQSIWSPRFSQNNRLRMFLPIGESTPRALD